MTRGTSGTGGAWFVCAFCTGGAVRCAGGDNFGETATPAGTFAEISGSNFNTCGLRTDGTVFCWGREDYYPPPKGTFTALARGYMHSCAMRADSTVVSSVDSDRPSKPPKLARDPP